MSRRLPVYILIDTSGSMKGEPIESVKVGLSDMIASLRLDPYALETACISIITYDKDVKQILPLSELENLQLPDIELSMLISKCFDHYFQFMLRFYIQG